jgi:hypothetical protein
MYDSWITLAGITDTEDEAMPGSIEADTWMAGRNDSDLIRSIRVIKTKNFGGRLRRMKNPEWPRSAFRFIMPWIKTLV